MSSKIFKLSIIAITAVMLTLIVLMESCNKSSNPGPNQVFMQNLMFNPTTVTVAVNATVTWTNKDNVGHNVTSDSGWFASSTIDPGNTYSHQFTAAGTYHYHCTIHQNMNGTVVVQ